LIGQSSVVGRQSSVRIGSQPEKSAKADGLTTDDRRPTTDD